MAVIVPKIFHCYNINYFFLICVKIKKHRANAVIYKEINV